MAYRGIHDQPKSAEWYERYAERTGEDHADFDYEYDAEHASVPCAICGEPCDGRAGGTAEMYDADDPEIEVSGSTSRAGFVHTECGLAAGWAIA